MNPYALGLIAVGVVAGLLIKRWWVALLLPVSVAVVARIALGDQGDFGHWTLPFVAAILVTMGLGVGAGVPFVVGEFRRRDEAR